MKRNNTKDIDNFYLALSIGKITVPLNTGDGGAHEEGDTVSVLGREER